MPFSNSQQLDEFRSLEILFNQSDDLLCIAGTDGFFKRVNPAFSVLLGWSSQELLKTSYFDLIHPEDIEDTHIQLSKLALGDTVTNFVNRFKGTDGTYYDIQWNVKPDQLTGNLIAIGRNVTTLRIIEDRLKASEDHFRSFFENSQGLMCTHDLQGNLLTVNSAGAGILGYSPAELKGTNLRNLIPSKHRPAFQSYLSEISRTGRAAGIMTTLHKDGTYRIWNYHNTLITGRDGSSHIVGNSIDVTESYLMEKDLRRAQEMLLQTNRVARVGGWEVDLVNNTIFWSQVTREIHEVDQDFVPDLGTALDFYKEGESREKISKAFYDAVAGKGDYNVEVELITGNGRSIWVRAIGHPEFEDGVCKRVYGTFQDIDQQKRTELEVSKSRKLLNDVLNAASEVGIIATDQNGVITVFNKGAEKLLGYSSQEVTGNVRYETFHLETEVRSRSEQLLLKYGKNIQGFRVFVHQAELNSSDTHEWTYLNKSGESIPVSLVVTVIRDHENEVIGYLYVATDLSARRRAENDLKEERARLMAFVEHAPAAVAMFDKNLRYLAMSRKWIEDYRLWGRNLLGISHYEIFPNIEQSWKDIHARCLDGETISNKEEMWRPLGWQNDQYFSWEVRPWRQFDGQVGGIMMFTQDVTQAVQQREDLWQARILAEQASAAKSEFLANMSHEIRTPLNGIIGFTELVLKTNLSPTQIQYLNIVNQSASTLLTVINDILDFSKIEAGKLELDVERCDIYEMMSQASDIISFPIQKKGLEMLLDVPLDLPRFAWVDGVRLKQVLVNLLSNAAKFTETGEVQLKIERLWMDTDNFDEAVYRFSVRDTGIGIKAEKQAKIFTAFEQEDGTTTKKYGGTGLGLTISNKLLGMMGSRLELVSSHGHGSTFYFDLKLKVEQGPPTVWSGLDQIKKVLVVDDNEHNRTILKNMLQLFSIDSDLAESGLVALEKLALTRYDAVLMDYHMPDLDGLETIGRIREDFPAQLLPIVLLTSSADDATVITASSLLGIKQRVVKPVKLHDVVLCLTRLFQENGIVEPLPLTTSAFEPLHQDCLILIAEDNPANMFLAKTMVSRIMPESRILEAKNGIEAVEMCEKMHPDLIFMDIQMPEMNGYDATMAIRQLTAYNALPIVALTAGNVKGEKERCLQAGMNDFVAKPFVEQNIRQVLEKYINLALQETSTIAHKSTENPHFDLMRVKQIYMDDEVFIAEFLELVHQTLTGGLSDLKAALSGSKLEEIRSIGHKVKGAASSACLWQVTSITRRFEEIEQFDRNYLQELIGELESELEIVIPMILECTQA